MASPAVIVGLKVNAVCPFLQNISAVAAFNKLTFTRFPSYYFRMKNYSFKLAATDVAECALFVALMVAGAFIRIPFPMVPLTFQTAFAVLAGLLLGWKKGMIATAVYAFMGLVGIPVFSAEPFGGFAYVLKPSFGYILGFIASAGVAGICRDRGRKLWQLILLALAACLADYVIGTLYFIAVWQINAYGGLGAAIVTYNLIYLPKDVILAVLAAVIAFAVLPVIDKMHGKVRKQSAQKQHNSND